jgi:hypothetical protein
MLPDRCVVENITLFGLGDLPGRRWRGAAGNGARQLIFGIWITVCDLLG